jgi:hypothetical protein
MGRSAGGASAKASGQDDEPYFGTPLHCRSCSHCFSLFRALLSPCFIPSHLFRSTGREMLFAHFCNARTIKVFAFVPLQTPTWANTAVFQWASNVFVSASSAPPLDDLGGVGGRIRCSDPLFGLVTSSCPDHPLPVSAFARHRYIRPPAP